MHTATSSRDTWIKKSPRQASELSVEQKKACKAGERLLIESYERADNGHWRIKVNDEIFYIYDVAVHGPESHWHCSWEQDTKEVDTPAPRALQTMPQACYPLGVALRPGDSFDALITPNFSYGELCNYSEERRFISAESVYAAYDLFMFLEKVRAHFCEPVTITSGHRPPAVNKRVGGASVSEHLFRAKGIGAVDFCIQAINIYDVQNYCDKHWPHSVGYGATRGFVHLGIGRGYVRWDY